MSAALKGDVRPAKWRSVKLAAILKLINGRAYKKDEERDSGTPVLRIQNLNGGDSWFYSDLSLPENKYCDKGDLLFAWSATFGPYIWWGEKVIYHYHIWKIECGPDLDKKFAYYLLQHITERVKAAGRGISMIHMTKSGMEDWDVSIPPLDEQKRIAAILDQADELRRKRQRAIDRLNQFGKAAFDQLDVSNGTWSQLSEVCVFENGDRGKNYPGKKSLLSQGVPFVSAADLDANGDISGNNLSYISDDKFRILRSGKFSGGDFLFCLRGSLGKFALVPNGMSGAIASSLIIIRISNSIDPEYFRAYLGSRLVQREIEFYSNGLAQPNLSGASLKKFKIFIPPTEVQRKFGETMSQINEARKHFCRSKTQMDRLFYSVQHTAFRGEL